MDTEVLKEKIGAIISSQWSANTKLNGIMELIDQPQESNKVVENDWEIVEYLYNGKIYDKRIGNNFYNDNYYLINNHKSTINAVRIQFTGEVYRVKDKVVWDWLNVAANPKYYTIDTIEIRANEMRIGFEESPGTWYTLNGCIQKDNNFRHYVEESTEQNTDIVIDGVKYIVTKSMADEINQILQDAIKNGGEKKQEALLVTEDGGKCYDRHRLVYGINMHIWTKSEPYTVTGAQRADPNWKWFSSEVARNQYILMNKPMFSYNELRELSGTDRKTFIGISNDKLLMAAEEKLKM